MPSITTNFNTTSQQDKILLKKVSETNNNINTKYSSPISPICDTIKKPHSRQNSQNTHNHPHHHNHVRRLSSLDCYTLKNEIVKLNIKSSYCFDNNTYDYSKSSNWESNYNYHIGDLVCYNRQYYKVIQDVLSQETQTPDIANDYYILIISRVSKVASKRVLISKWTPYCRFIAKGEQVFYDGKVWTALVSQNYENDKKRNPLFVADSPDQPSQKGLWEIEDYNIDELEIVEDMIEFTDDDDVSLVSSDESEREIDADIDSSSTISGADSYISNISKDLNDVEITSSSSSLNTPNLMEKNYIKDIRRHESESSTNSDNTMNDEEDFNYIKFKKDISDKKFFQKLIKNTKA